MSSSMIVIVMFECSKQLIACAVDLHASDLCTVPAKIQLACMCGGVFELNPAVKQQFFLVRGAHAHASWGLRGASTTGTTALDEDLSD